MSNDAGADVALHVVLVRPEIPQNTGSIARLVAATRIRLHLVGPLGFRLEDRYLKRAGLDYWPLVDVRVYNRWEEFWGQNGNGSFKYFSARATKSFNAVNYRWGDFLVFGSETAGLGTDFLADRCDTSFRIPILEAGVRSLNLSNAVAIVVYTALGQLGVLPD
jgi:tRNA (cytidine/uridine-2'-O-)-methyltransferase